MRKDFRGFDFSVFDLTSSNFRGFNLSGADLSGADLSGAVFKDSNLSVAILKKVNLSGADLSGANLSGADLSGADLSSANLRNSNLCEANLSGVNLRGANLKSTNLLFANLESTDLPPIWEDMEKILSDNTSEIQHLVDSIRAGKIDGSTYEGLCSCLSGTLAHGESDMSLIKKSVLKHRNSERPIEMFFRRIEKGDTPENSWDSREVLDRILSFCKKEGINVK